MSHVRQLAGKIRNADTPGDTWRLGEVTATAGSTCTVTVAGESVSEVPTLGRVVSGASVWLRVAGGDLLAVGSPGRSWSARYKLAADSRTSLSQAEGSFTSHGGVLTITDPDCAVTVSGVVVFGTSKGSAVNATDISCRVQVSLDGGSTYTTAVTSVATAPANDDNTVTPAAFWHEGTTTGDIKVRVQSRRNDSAGAGTVNLNVQNSPITVEAT